MVCMSPREGEEILRTEDILDYIEQHGDEVTNSYKKTCWYLRLRSFSSPESNTILDSFLISKLSLKPVTGR